MPSNHLQSDSDVEQILRIAVADAVRSDDQTLRERLKLAANELGLNEDQLQRAEEKWIRERGMREDLAEYMAQQKRWFWPHAIAYLAVNVSLVMLNIREWDGFPWAAFPLFGWGIGLFAHAQEMFNTKSDEFRKEFQKWRAERKGQSELPE
jgi:hypothetical protein